MNYIVSRYKSKCAETGKQIKKGDNCLYDPSLKKVYHMDSQVAKEWKEEQQEGHRQAGMMAQANEEAFFDNFCQTNNI